MKELYSRVPNLLEPVVKGVDVINLEEEQQDDLYCLIQLLKQEKQLTTRAKRKALGDKEERLLKQAYDVIKKLNKLLAYLIAPDKVEQETIFRSSGLEQPAHGGEESMPRKAQLILRGVEFHGFLEEEEKTDLYCLIQLLKQEKQLKYRAHRRALNYEEMRFLEQAYNVTQKYNNLLARLIDLNK